MTYTPALMAAMLFASHRVKSFTATSINRRTLHHICSQMKNVHRRHNHHTACLTQLQVTDTGVELEASVKVCDDHHPLLTPIPTDRYNKDSLPAIFAYPHSYEPHPIAKLAADDLRKQIQSSENQFFQANNETVGKMMGVMVVQYQYRNNGGENSDDKHLGYLKAYSGTLPPGITFPKEEGFCPPIYDRFDIDGFYKQGEDELNELNRLVDQSEYDPQRQLRKEKLNKIQEACNVEWKAAKKNEKTQKKERRLIRQNALDATIDEREYEMLDERLKQEGAAIQRQMKQLKLQIRDEVSKAQDAVDEIETRLQDLEVGRRDKSRELQDKLFNQYNFLNIQGETRSLLPMFAETPLERPPPGAGDCVAPKLFQYAFSKGYEPVAMCEFWWGKCPMNEVRRHNLYYPASRGKCQPILEHMLEGMQVGENPMEIIPETGDELEVLYEDDYMVIVNKPEGMLSAPGRILEHSVYSVMKEKYPNATGPLLVHRLDMSTSGILLIAKDKDIHKALAAQFIDRSIKKRYTGKP